MHTQKKCICFCLQLDKMSTISHIELKGLNWLPFSTTIIFIIFCDFLKFYQIFLSPQVKRCTIISYKHRIYELPHGCRTTEDSGSWEIRKYQESVNIFFPSNSPQIPSNLIYLSILITLRPFTQF